MANGDFIYIFTNVLLTKEWQNFSFNFYVLREQNGNSTCNILFYLFIFSFIFISWRLITSQHFNGFCHTLTWISHGYTCIPHPHHPSHLPLHPIPLGLPSAPGPSTCLMHPTWAGDTCNILNKGPLLVCVSFTFYTFSHERYHIINIFFLFSWVLIFIKDLDDIDVLEVYTIFFIFISRCS